MGTYKCHLPFCECGWGVDSTWRWWRDINTTLCNQNCFNFLLCLSLLGTQKSSLHCPCTPQTSPPTPGTPCKCPHTCLCTLVLSHSLHLPFAPLELKFSGTYAQTSEELVDFVSWWKRWFLLYPSGLFPLFHQLLGQIDSDVSRGKRLRPRTFSDAFLPELLQTRYLPFWLYRCFGQLWKSCDLSGLVSHIVAPPATACPCSTWISRKQGNLPQVGSGQCVVLYCPEFPDSSRHLLELGSLHPHELWYCSAKPGSPPVTSSQLGMSLSVFLPLGSSYHTFLSPCSEFLLSVASVYLNILHFFCPQGF